MLSVLHIKEVIWGFCWSFISDITMFSFIAIYFLYPLHEGMKSTDKCWGGGGGGGGQVDNRTPAIYDLLEN